MTNRYLDIDFHGNTLRLLPEKALIHLETMSLLLSDIHLGKENSMLAQGLSIPKGASALDLQRINIICDVHNIKRVYILGDFIHDQNSIDPLLHDLIKDWLDHRGIRTVLIEGNHDRHLPNSCDDWSLERIPQTKLNNLHLMHTHNTKSRGVPSIAGHLHPCILLANRFDSIRLPCFVKENDQLTLPAFGSLTGGFTMERMRGRSFFATTKESVVQI